MKKIVLFILLICSLYVNGQAPTFTANTFIPSATTSHYAYGINAQFYGDGSDPAFTAHGLFYPNYQDSIQAHIARDLGAKSERLGDFEDQYYLFSLPNGQPNWAIHKANYLFYGNQGGMSDIACFMNTVSDGNLDKRVYNNPVATGNTHSPYHSLVFRNLYDSTNNGNIWNADGSPDTVSPMVRYVKNFVLTYGQQATPKGGVRYFSVWNEPDIFDYSGTGIIDTLGVPAPQDMHNLYCPAYFYIRMLRITYEVAHHYYPNCIVLTGGIGYPGFLHFLLTNTDNPGSDFTGDPTKGSGTKSSLYPNFGGAYFDAIDFHNYPGYSWSTYNNTTNRTDRLANSDNACNIFLASLNGFKAYLAQYGYDGTKYPAKFFICTETDLPSYTSFNTWATFGSYEIERNYDTKIAVIAQRNGIRQVYYYAQTDNVVLPNNANNPGDPNGSMGKYFFLSNHTSYSQFQKKPSGVAMTTHANLFYGYDYDATKSAALNLPSTCDGGAFTNSTTGVTRYVLWAKCTGDADESLVAGNQTLKNSQNTTFTNVGRSITYTIPSGISFSKIWNWDASYVPNNGFIYWSSYPYQSFQGQKLILTGTPIFVQ